MSRKTANRFRPYPRPTRVALLVWVENAVLHHRKAALFPIAIAIAIAIAIRTINPLYHR